METPRSAEFEVSCQKCAMRRYVKNYWEARTLAGVHWETTGHPTDIIGGYEDQMRVLFTFYTAVTR